MLLRCLPTSICSWNFNVDQEGSYFGSTVMRSMTETGEIHAAGSTFGVTKGGMFSGRWTLDEHGLTMAEATKPSSMFRAYELAAEGRQYDLAAVSVLSRPFAMKRGGRLVLTIQPVHPFTRRSEIHVMEDTPAPVVMFAFWLTAMTWRRQARSSAAAG